MALNDKLITFAALDPIPADLLNKLQERSLPAPANPGVPGLDETPHASAAATVVTSGSPPATTITLGPGGMSRYGFSKGSGGGIPAGGILVLDHSVSWADRFLTIRYRIFAAGDSGLLPGGASDGQFARGGYDPATQLNTKVNGQLLYTSAGSDNGAGANPTAGNPPSPGPGTAGAGDFVAYLFDEAVSTDLMLYVEKLTPWRLCVYNAGASAYHIAFWAEASAILGKR
jgi:hypothetical protein